MQSEDWQGFEDPPVISADIWVCIEGQVKLARWSMQRQYEDGSTEPGITWCEPWLGTGQPSHWMFASRPKPPQSLSMDQK